MATASDNPLPLLRRLEWRVRHAAANVLTGEYRSAFRGRGMEFDQVVRYEFGDDVRDIDWNVTARLGEPYRKKFVEERELTVLVALADSPGLQFGSTGETKRAVLLELAGLIMLLGAVNRDRVGFIHLTPGDHTFFPPVRGRGPILQACSRLLSLPTPSLQAQGDFRAPWSLLSKAVPKHSILVWLGDYDSLALPPDWSKLQQRFQTLGFRADDPWDRALPEQTGLSLFDPLSGRVVPLDNTTAQREAHAQWRAQRDALFAAQFPDRLSRLAVDTRENRLDALVRFFQHRLAASSR